MLKRDEPIEYYFSYTIPNYVLYTQTNSSLYSHSRFICSNHCPRSLNACNNFQHVIAIYTLLHGRKQSQIVSQSTQEKEPFTAGSQSPPRLKTKNQNAIRRRLSHGGHVHQTGKNKNETPDDSSTQCFWVVVYHICCLCRQKKIYKKDRGQKNAPTQALIVAPDSR